MAEKLYTEKEIFIASKARTGGHYRMQKVCGHQHKTLEAARKCASKLGKNWYAGSMLIRKWKKGVKITKLGGS